MNKNSINAAPFLAGLGVVAAALLAGCGGGGSSSSSSSSPPAPAPTYLLGGTVSGLSEGGTLTFANGSDTVVVGANGSFTFPNRLASGASYKVSLTNSPRGHDCRLSNAAATVASANVTAISVECIPYALAGKEVPLYQPGGLAVDADGNAYVADSYYHVIQRITPAGVISTFAGAKNGGAGGVDGPAGEARFQFTSATAMIIDRDGSLIVGDSCNRSIRRVTKAGVVSTVAGPSPAPCGGAKDGVAMFGDLPAIALDVNGDYLVSAGPNEIRRVTPAGKVSTIPWTAPALVGSTDTLEYIRKLTVDKNGIVYAIGSGKRVWKIAGGVATPLAGGATATISALDGVGAAAGFKVLQALTNDNAGNLYVSDFGALRKIGSDGTVSSFAGIYTPPYVGALPAPPDVIDGAAAAARFGAPTSLAMDVAGNIVAFDQTWNVLRNITPQGVVTTNPGTPLLVQYRDGAGSSARFTNYALRAAPTVDAKGNIFVRDSATVRMITPDGTVSRYAGILNSPGSLDGSKDSATLGVNGRMATDNAGNLYLTGGGVELWSQLRKIGSGGVTSTLFQRPEFTNAAAIAASATGKIAVASQGGGVKVYSQDGTVLDTIDQARVVASLGTGNPSSYNAFAGLVYDPSGNLFIGDPLNGVIHKLSKDGILSTFAGKPGLPGEKDGGPGAGTFNGSGELTIDPSGNLYTLSGDRLKVRKITPSGVISTSSLPWENPSMSGVAYGNGRLYAMSKNALMQMWVP